MAIPAFSSVQAAFPKLNMIRIAYIDWAGNAENDAGYLAFIDAASAAHVVCICEDNSTSNSWSWTQAQINTYTGLASRYKNNPYVWFESFNDPAGPTGSMTDVAIMNAIRAQYDAVRAAGNNNPFLICLPGGSYTDILVPNAAYISGGSTPSYRSSGPGAGGSSVTAMRNVAYDFHYYGTAAGNGGTTNLDTGVLLNGTTYSASGLHGAGYVWLQTNAPHSADGIMPVILGKWGPGTTSRSAGAFSGAFSSAFVGSSSVVADANMITAVLQQSGPAPYPAFPNLAWNWEGATPDNLTSGGSPTNPYGTSVSTWQSSYATQLSITITTGSSAGVGTAPGISPTGDSVSGSQSVGTSGSGPVITGPASAAIKLSHTFASFGVNVTDTIWPHAGADALNVSCSSGTVSVFLGGVAQAGSGTNSIALNDTDANTQAMVSSLSYTAPASGVSDSISVEVFDQFGQNTALTIPVTLS